MNREELKQNAVAAAAQCLARKGYIAMVDVLMEMGWLSREGHERWRLLEVPFLERVVHANLTKLDAVVRAVRANSINGKLKPSRTVYTSGGRGNRQLLRFTRTGNPFLGEAYSTHYLRPTRPNQTETLGNDGADHKSKSSHLIGFRVVGCQR